jgi:hypothetical protein
MPCKARCRVVVVIGDLFQHRLDISHPPPVTWQSRRLIFAVLIFSVSYLSIRQLTSRTVPKRWTPRSYSTCRAVDGNTPSDKYASRSAGYFSNAELPAQLSRGPEIECALHTRTALTVSVAMALAGDHATASISITYEYYYTTSKTLRTEKQVGRQQLMSTELLYIGSTANWSFFTYHRSDRRGMHAGRFRSQLNPRALRVRCLSVGGADSSCLPAEWAGY